MYHLKLLFCLLVKIHQRWLKIRGMTSFTKNAAILTTYDFENSKMVKSMMTIIPYHTFYLIAHTCFINSRKRFFLLHDVVPMLSVMHRNFLLFILSSFRIRLTWRKERTLFMWYFKWHSLHYTVSGCESLFIYPSSF